MFEIFYRRFFGIDGIPVRICFSEKLLVTTGPAPTIISSARDILGKIIAPAPIQQFFPTFTAPSKIAPGPISVNSPTTHS